MTVSNLTACPGTTRVAAGRPAPTAPRGDSQPQADPPFDLSMLDSAREVYFMPGVDRLAASLAGGFKTPVTVRVEAEGQFLEYTLNSAHPEAPVPGSLNGNPFELTPEAAAGGVWRLTGETSGGGVKTKSGPIPHGTQMSGLVNGMPIGERIVFNSDPDDSRVAGLVGNFACARLDESVTRQADGSYLVAGQLGKHTISARLRAQEDSSLVMEGDFGDIRFRQTLTPHN